MILKWHEEADEEFVSAALYYEGKEDGLGDRFISEMEVALSRLLANPLGPRVFDRVFRKARFSKFPYALVYQAKADRIHIIAVMHSSRQPGYWKGRIDAGEK